MLRQSFAVFFGICGMGFILCLLPSFFAGRLACPAVQEVADKSGYCSQGYDYLSCTYGQHELIQPVS